MAGARRPQRTMHGGPIAAVVGLPQTLGLVSTSAAREGAKAMLKKGRPSLAKHVLRRLSYFEQDGS